MKRSRASGDSAARARPEQVFFDDPAVDRLMGVVMALATEHYVLRDRVKALEARLGGPGGAAPDDEDTQQADAAEFAAELLRPLLGLQQAVGAPGRFSLKAPRRRRARR